MQNIELFNEYVARILAQLYESFPVKEPVDPCQISGHTNVNRSGATIAPASGGSKEALVAFNTIAWLVDNGYVHADEYHPGRNYVGCALTDKGLRLLRAVPESVQAKETVGDKLVEMIKEGSIDLAMNYVKEILMRGAAGAF